MRIINAKIYTMSDAVIDSGFVEFENGKIFQVGLMGEALSGYAGETVDAEGAMLFPGFIDGHTHLGLFEDSLGFEGDDGNEDTDPCTPQLRAIDGVNPMDRCFRDALMAGVTSVLTGPGSANAIGGQIAAVKTAGLCIDNMILKAPVAMKIALGENPKTVYHGKNQSPVTRMATVSIIREQLNKAQKYAKQVEDAANDSELEEPEYDAKCDALIGLLSGGIPAHFHAHRLDDIFTAARIAEEFNLKYTIVHCTQGHLAAEALREKGIQALSGPFLCDRSKPELHDLSPESPGILTRSGVKTAIVTDHPVIPIQYLPLCAGLAVREGMDFEEALKAITINPAEICGIADRVGSIETGKDADFVLFKEDPLTLAARPFMVFCDGKRVL